MSPMPRPAHKLESSNFVYFSHSTQGRDGRAVFIDPALLAKFLAQVDVAHFKGQKLIKAIEQLRAKGGGISSHQNLNNAMEHMDKFDDVMVYYRIIGQSAPENKGAGIYVTDIQVESKETGNMPGLYIYSNKDIIPSKKTFFDLDNGVIGAGSSTQSVVGEMKDHIKDDWGQTPDYGLYYVPEALANKFGCWITPEQKTFNSDKASSELATVLSTTQKFRLTMQADKPTRIRVYGQGSKLLESALEKVHGHMDQLGFQFIEPASSLQPVYAKLKRSNAKLAPESVVSKTRKSQVGLAVTRHQLNAELTGLNRSGEVKSIAANNAPAINALQVGQGGLAAGTRYFVDALTQANKIGRWS